MSMKRALFIVAVAAVAGAYVAGYWPEHRRLADAEAQVQALQAKLDAADARVRLGEVLGQLLRLSDAVAARNYGEATALSSRYFDRVRAEAARPAQGGAMGVLDTILRSRDQVTAALARSEPTVPALRQQELALREALGYPVEPPAAAPPAEAR